MLFFSNLSRLAICLNSLLCEKLKRKDAYSEFINTFNCMLLTSSNTLMLGKLKPVS